LIQGSQIQLRIKGLRNIKSYIAIRPVQFSVTQDFGRKNSRSASEICQAAGVWQRWRSICLICHCCDPGAGDLGCRAFAGLLQFLYQRENRDKSEMEMETSMIAIEILY
jgi:hypothetical protein